MKFRNYLLAVCTLLAFSGTQLASAALYTSSLGNTTPGFNDGDTPAVFLVGGAQGGQPAPFDTGYGTDGLFGGNFAQNWTHSYAPIAEEILSASITIGIYDHDSSASGSQLALFDLDGNDLTASLDSQFEAVGDGLDLMYNEYTLSLGASLFSDLADGSLVVTLNMMGPGLTTPLFPLPGPNPPVETSTNGANLIYSTLTINTVPIPAAAPLFASAIVLMGLYRRRVARNAA